MALRAVENMELTQKSAAAFVIFGRLLIPDVWSPRIRLKALETGLNDGAAKAKFTCDTLECDISCELDQSRSIVTLSA